MNFKDEAKTILTKEEAAAKGFFATHRTTIVVGVVCFLLGLILPHVV